ncbi:hypothetical protein LCGC14_0372200 [marine sediment metagenome]|uniref:Uncharacterized protein n=1 Tax=marine sediment metagenome TaxID=412755 RepID=A0A0F9TAH9_9ZZZZ
MIRLEVSLLRVKKIRTIQWIPDGKIHLLNLKKFEFINPKEYKYIEIIINSKRFGF